jgi:23S rRNA pseudouridine1911/1915/1917 synthase
LSAHPPAPDALRPQRLELTVADDAVPARLDQWLAAAVVDLGRNRAKRLILDGAVSVGGTAVREPTRPVRPGDRVGVDLPPPEPANPQPEAIPLAVVYEDDEIIVIDKPAGLVVHPGAGNPTGTLVNALLAHAGDSLSGIGGVVRPGIVHRLDKDTSGLLVIAKTDRAHHALAAAFAAHGRDGALVRAYKALAWGVPQRREGTIDVPLGRSTANRLKIAVRKEGGGGREAVTHYRLMERYGELAALLECRLETGRTHQIRVHLAAIGHPVVGDATYGAAFRTKAERLSEPARSLANAFPRQALHAYLLGFTHPVTGKKLRFESALPPDMEALVAAFRTSAAAVRAR